MCLRGSVYKLLCISLLFAAMTGAIMVDCSDARLNVRVKKASPKEQSRSSLRQSAMPKGKLCCKNELSSNSLNRLEKQTAEPSMCHLRRGCACVFRCESCRESLHKPVQESLNVSLWECPQASLHISAMTDAIVPHCSDVRQSANMWTKLKFQMLRKDEPSPSSLRQSAVPKGQVLLLLMYY